jgi:hypothetical protein
MHPNSLPFPLARKIRPHLRRKPLSPRPGQSPAPKTPLLHEPAIEQDAQGQRHLVNG